MASGAGFKIMFIKNSAVFILSLLVSVSYLSVSGQTKNIGDSQNKSEKTASKSDASGFYETEFLKRDYREVDVAAYVDIKERTLVDSTGNVDCGNDAGTGYCIYRLTADLKEVFKGKISKKVIEFYAVPDADYPKKHLMGERVVFLERSDNYPDKKPGLGTLQNSTRRIEFGILQKMRKIAGKKKSNGKNRL